jgi:DNA-binding MarR family transcriptional regulator
LLLVAHSFRQDLAAALQLAVSDTFALSHLAVAHTLSAGELAHRAGLAPSSVTALLDRMERAGLVRRTVQPADRRSQQISLTDRGRQVLVVSGRWLAAGLGAVPAEELPALARQLRTVAAAMRAEGEAFSSAVAAGTMGAPFRR